MTAQLVEIPGYVAGTWTVDTAHSTVGFAVRHLMISKVRGRFDDFEATFVTGADPLDSHVTATVRMDSVDTGNAQRDAHLRTAEYFGSDEHPTMTFRSTGLRPARGAGRFELAGDLTIKGVTRPVTFDLEIGGFGPDAFDPAGGGARAGFLATGVIDRTEFGVDTNMPIPGGVALGEKVEITLEVEAVLTTPAE
ncbi:YceI family protein [Actinomadura logoneensis]|uniref:YceI family protein n=1 Tax=Actinomadura logoneensis TaxID=2293572 RepID=A0A372JMD0_9ACTN|nr:YceI family protein [Actinomadura logoneensis]RFU40508.1 YceI family protein [Actinomadura logoneensis]